MKKSAMEMALAAMKRARHNLTTLNGLWAQDSKPEGQAQTPTVFQIKETTAIEELDQAIGVVERLVAERDRVRGEQQAGAA